MGLKICVFCRDETKNRSQGADFENNQTTKQLNNSIWTNRKQVLFLHLLVQIKNI